MTTETITLMQSLFDRAVTGVKQQGRLSKRALYPDDRFDVVDCFYRHPDNPAIRCAVGHVIPDEHYFPEMEDKPASAVLTHAPLRQALFGDASSYTRCKCTYMLYALQSAHDSSDDVAHFLNLAADVARRFDLNADVCKEN